MAGNLLELEAQLRELSHDNQGIELIQAFAAQLGKTKHRQAIFNAKEIIRRNKSHLNKKLWKIYPNDIIIFSKAIGRSLIPTTAAPCCLSKL